MSGVMRALLEGYASLFVHCWEYYAVQRWDERLGVWSYRPAYYQLTLARLFDHLQGRYTLGTYVVDQQGFCSFALFDDDGEDGLIRLVLLAEELAEQGISLLLEASRRGGHGWVFFERPVLASYVRRWLLPYALKWGMELYPSSDGVRSGGVGHLVRLPLGVHRKSGWWYPFVVVGSNGEFEPVGETVVDCCAWAVASAQRVLVPVEVGERGDRVSVSVQVVGEKVEGNVSCRGRGAIREWCASQDIVEVIGRYTSLDRRGVGRCPLPGHHKRGDIHPSLQVFEGTDPHWYCYTWKRAGNVFDFLQLYYGLTVQEAWERLQAGMLVE